LWSVPLSLICGDDVYKTGAEGELNLSGRLEVKASKRASKKKGSAYIKTVESSILSTEFVELKSRFILP